MYGTDAMDYIQSGWSYKYDRYGNTLDSNEVGIILVDTVLIEIK